MPERTCKYCGEIFAYTHAVQVYCSAKCREAKKYPARRRVSCSSCGEPTGVMASARREGFDHKCRSCLRRPCGTVAAYKRGCRCADCRKANRDSMRAYAAKREAEGHPLRSKPLMVRVCQGCGVEFNPRSNQVLCSPECRMAQLGRYGDHCSRAAYFGVDYEVIDRVALFERDGWVCGICQLPVDPQVKFPDPGSASLDHIVPMSRGGGHVWSNTTLAHFYCNAVKGNRDMEVADAC